MIYHDHERVKTVGDRQVGDEIIGDLGKGSSCSGAFDRHQRWVHWVPVYLCLLTGSTSINKVLHKRVHPRPPVIVSQQFQSLQVARVAHGGQVMVLFHYFSLQPDVIGYIAFILVEYNASLTGQISFGGFHSFVGLSGHLTPHGPSLYWKQSGYGNPDQECSKIGGPVTGFFGIVCQFFFS